MLHNQPVCIASLLACNRRRMKDNIFFVPFWRTSCGGNSKGLFRMFRPSSVLSRPCIAQHCFNCQYELQPENMENKITNLTSPAHKKANYLNINAVNWSPTYLWLPASHLHHKARFPLPELTAREMARVDGWPVSTRQLGPFLVPSTRVVETGLYWQKIMITLLLPHCPRFTKWNHQLQQQSKCLRLIENC